MGAAKLRAGASILFFKEKWWIWINTRLNQGGITARQVDAEDPPGRALWQLQVTGYRMQLGCTRHFCKSDSIGNER
jgi:hypothetical protein